MNNRKTGAKFAALFFSFTTMAAVGTGAQAHSWDYYYNKAYYRQSQGDYAGAISDLNTALKLSPDNAVIYNARGLIYEKFGDYLSAMADYERALSINPSSAEALHNINNLNSKTRGHGNSAPYIPNTQPVQEQVHTRYAGAAAVPQGGRLPAGVPAAGVAAAPQGGRLPAGVPAAAPQGGRLPAGVPAAGVAAAPQGGRLPAGVPAAGVAAAPQGGRLPAGVPPAGVAASPQEGRLPAGTFDGYPANSAYGQTREYGNAAPVPAGFGQPAAGGGMPYTNESGVSYRYPANTSQPPLNAVGNTSARYSNAPAFTTPVQKVYIDPIAETYNSYGVALSGYGLYDEAILQFTEAIKTYSSYAIAYNNRGLAFASKGDWERASADFDQALRINPYYYDAQFNRARVNGMPLKR
jgi:tetratricopeptide (TPR) repeat protein